VKTGESREKAVLDEGKSNTGAERELFEIVEASELSTLSTLFASGCHSGMQCLPECVC
jgi:hypothetical protein